MKIEDKIIKPYRFDEMQSLKTENLCGSNFFSPENKTIQFLITGDLNCIVETQLMNIIYVRMFWDMTEQKFREFFDKNFHLKTASLLQISSENIQFLDVKKVTPINEDKTKGTPLIELDFVISTSVINEDSYYPKEEINK